MEDQTLDAYRCAICGGEKGERLFFGDDYLSGETFQVCRCVVCGMVATKPELGPGDFGKYYPELYFGQRKSFTDYWINTSRIHKINKLNRQQASVNARRRLLDIGCGDGSFISRLAEEDKWEVIGTEMASEGSHAQKSPDFIYRKELVECNFENAYFDIITMWHVLEHFQQPLVYLTEARRILKPEGVLLCEVPNFDSWQARMFTHNWFHLDVPRHTFHYEMFSLKYMLEKTGFIITKTSHVSFFYGFFGLVQSMLNVLCRRKNFLFDCINRKISVKQMRENYRDSLMTFILLLPISLVLIPFFVLETMCKRGGIVTVWAKKTL